MLIKKCSEVLKGEDNHQLSSFHQHQSLAQSRYQAMQDSMTHISPEHKENALLFATYYLCCTFAGSNGNKSTDQERVLKKKAY